MDDARRAAAVEQALPYIEKVVELLGYPPAAAKIYAYMLVRGGPVTVAELARATGLGRSTVAANIKLLEHDGLVYSVKRGRQRLYYLGSRLPQVLIRSARLLRDYMLQLLEAVERLRGQSPEIEAFYREAKILVEAVEKAIEVYEEVLTRRLGSPGGW